MFGGGPRKGSLLDLGLAVAAGLLYIFEDVTTDVSTDVLKLLTQFFAIQYPTMKELLIPIIQPLQPSWG